MIPIILIAATDRNGAIGRQNQIPWYLPDELSHFKNMTSNHCVLMGRGTFESIGKPLPNRTNLVLSSNPLWNAIGAQRVSSLDEALAISHMEYPEEALYIAGGGQIYAQTMEFAHSAIISRLDLEVYDADTYFPDFGRNWLLLNTEVKQDSRTQINFVVERWVNKSLM